MAVKYLRSAAAGTGTGADWTNAYTTLTLALAGVSAGDTIYVADDHAETTAGAVTLTSPGTSGSPIRILCVNTHVTVPPTGAATSATVSTSGANSLVFGTGHSYIEGIAFQTGTGAVSATLSVASAAGSTGLTFKNCSLKIVATGNSSSIAIGQSSARDCSVIFDNTTISFGAAAQQIQLAGCTWKWKNTASAIGGTVPTVLILPVTGRSYVMFAGVDLSAMVTGKSLITVSNTGSPGIEIHLRNCKLGSGITFPSGTILGPGGTMIYVDNCDSTSGNTRFEHYKYQGKILSDTANYITSGGATDGTTPISHKLTSLTTGPTLFSPLEGLWVPSWIDTLSAYTISVEFLHDKNNNGGADLTNADIYLEVEYLGTSGFPESVFASNRVADVFASASAHPAGVGAGSWTISPSMTTADSQKLQVTFTPTLKGLVRWRVCLVKANYTVYVDPQASGLATVSRAYLMPPGMYMNETSAGAGGVGMIKSRVVTGF